MSKLYLKARTDMRKTELTARANREIEIELYFDESDYNSFIPVRLTRDEKEICLYVDDTPVYVIALEAEK